MSSSQVEKNSSSSIGLVDCASGIVAPGWSVRSERPGVSSMYLSPSAERGRIDSSVSAGSSPTLLSSFMWITATARPSLSSLTAGSIRFTTPTRKPPIRTSLPTTRLEPPGISALTS